MRFVGVVVLALAVTGLTPAYAAEPKVPASANADGAPRQWLRQSAAPETGSAPSQGRPWGMMAGGVLLAALVAGALYRRRQLRQLAREKRVSRIQILDTTRIGAKAQLVTAVVGGRVVVLGVTETQISALTWLEPEEAGALDADPVEEESAPAAPVKGGAIRRYESVAEATDPSASARFRGMLRQAVGNPAERDSAAESAALRLARGTRDVVTCSSESTRRAKGAGKAGSIDVEGQAAGLIARLSKGQR